MVCISLTARIQPAQGEQGVIENVFVYMRILCRQAFLLGIITVGLLGLASTGVLL